MKTVRFIVLMWVLVACVVPAVAQETHRYPGTDTSLVHRWSWAMDEASRAGAADFWVGYSIRRLMDEDSYIFSDNVISGRGGTRTSLYDILRIPKPFGPDSNVRPGSNDGTGLFKRMKDIALLFHCSVLPGGQPSVQNVRTCDMELSVDLKKEPVYWLGTTDDDQSVGQLSALYKTVSSTDARKHFVEAVGIHQQSDNAYPFLTGLLKSKEPDDVRARAAFWVSQQRNPGGLQFLMDIARNDRSLKVREQAVFAISLIDDGASTDALIMLVREADDTKVRAKAAFWLGQKASQKAVSTLESVVAGDDETDVQRQALFGLSRMKDREGIDRIIRIAESHPNPRLRKQAIQILGQSNDPKALDALIDIARK